MYHMKTTSVRELKSHFSKVEGLLRSGHTIRLTKRRRVIAHIIPPPRKKRVKMPDFMARLRKNFGKRKLKVSGAELIAWDRGRG